MSTGLERIEVRKKFQKIKETFPLRLPKPYVPFGSESLWLIFTDENKMGFLTIIPCGSIVNKRIIQIQRNNGNY